jgi:hypothetical protein
MRRGRGHPIARIGLGVLAVFVAICAILYILNPEGAVLVAAVFLQPLFSNAQPPAIADGHIKTDDELTDVLKQKFPAGTNEAVLKATLFRQGFKPATPPPVPCWPRGQPAPVGHVVFPCPVHDPGRMLEYQWSDFPCSDTITVWWTLGDNGEVAQIGGYHGHGCL